jgi:hypothetical protein
MERRWNKAWQDLPQKTLQKWVERIPHHIQAIIASKGGNEYCEAIPGYKRSWKGDRVKGILSTHSFIDPDRSAGHLTPVVVAEKLLKALPKEDLQHQGRQDSIPIQNCDSDVNSDDEDWIWDDDADEEYDKRYGI